LQQLDMPGLGRHPWKALLRDGARNRAEVNFELFEAAREERN